MDTSFDKIILAVHALIGVALITFVLLQRGKGADAGAGFGAGASGTVFGARGSANFFSRATAVLATAFFVSSLGLAYLTMQDAPAPESLFDGEPTLEPMPDSPEAALDSLPAVDEPVEAPASSTDELPSVDGDVADEADEDVSEQ